MTTLFLDEHGNGKTYWPSDPTAANFNSLQYSTDRTIIEQTIRQLIYLLNLQQRRYSKYKQKPKLIEQGLKAPSGTIPQKRSKIVPSTRRLRPIAPKPMRSSLGGMTKVSPSDRVDNIDTDRFYPPPISSIEAILSHDAVTGVGPQDQMSVPPNESDASRRAQVDSNIDPNLEPIFLPAPTRHHSMANRSRSPSNQSRSNAPSKADGAPRSTRSISAIFPISSRNRTEQDTENFSTAIPGPIVAPYKSSKASIRFTYQVILSRAPIYHVTNWRPEGYFSEKSLTELSNELPFRNKDSIIGLMIRLTGPGIIMEQTVVRNADGRDDYDVVMEELTDGAKLCLKNHKRTNLGSNLVMKFKIEAVRGGVFDEDKQDEDDGVMSS
ncbi:hypothetical protein PMIN06_013121 [Paraphaeosphaeria minitans]